MQCVILGSRIVCLAVRSIASYSEIGCGKVDRGVR